jgi:hypothetical protein
MKPSSAAAAIAIVLQFAASPVHGQDAAQPARPAQPAPPAPAAAQKVVPMKVVVTLSRYEGDRRVSSLPYTLSVNYTASEVVGKASLRMGTKVAVPSTNLTTTAKDGAQPITSFSYQDVGTNIDVTVWAADDDRYRVGVSISDSSVVDDKTQARLAPSFRTFSLSNQVVLKDGQSTQFSTAPDKVTGEVVKVDVSLNIVK